MTPLDLTLQRQHLADALRGGAEAPGADGDALERLLLAFEELVSNGLRHGRAPVRATVTAFDGCWLLEVSDAAADRPPTPAAGRDPVDGGLGLRLVARISSAHGWQTDGDRKTVWALVDRTPADGLADPAHPGVTPRLVGAVAGLSDALGFTPAIRFTGPVAHPPGDIVIDLVAVIREALTNVARHARARSAAVEAAVTPDAVTARVTDDGIGMSGAPRDGGLADLKRRAAWHRGSVSVTPGPSGGTQLLWTVPTPPTTPQAR